MKQQKYIFFFFLAVLLGICISLFFDIQSFFSDTDQIQMSKEPKNVIIVVIDGMGAAHLEAASWYKTGTPNALFLQQLPYSGKVDSIGSDNKVPDSANSMAMLTTGHKLPYRSLAQKQGKPLQTIAEYYKEKGKKIGLVVLSSITDATPAAYFSHQETRSYHDQIWRELLDFKPDLIMGGPALNKGKGYRDLTVIQEAGYQIVQNKESLLKVDPNKPVFGQFQWNFLSPSANYNMPWILDYAMPNYGIQATALKQIMSINASKVSHLPTLKEMALKSLEILQQSPDGYLLVLEQSLNDKAAHMGFKNNMVAEVLLIDDTIEALLPLLDEDTLLIVTADHETGGLELSEPFQKGQLPGMTFTAFLSAAKDKRKRDKYKRDTENAYKMITRNLSKFERECMESFRYHNHSARKFPIFAVGPGADQLPKMQHISDIHKILVKN